MVVGDGAGRVVVVVFDVVGAFRGGDEAHFGGGGVCSAEEEEAVWFGLFGCSVAGPD